MKIYLNGKIMDAAEAKISIFDRGYLFGEGVFETFRSYSGKIPFLDKHLARLEWSTTFVGIPFPHPQTIREAIFETLKAAQLIDARIKVILSGQNPQTMAPTIPTDDMEVNVLVTCEQFNPWSEEDYQDGVSLAVIRSVRNDPPPASNIKSQSRITKMIARKEFSEKSAFDGILLDAHGFVTETTSSNIFWLSKKGNALCTPPTSLGLLSGVTRQIVIDLAKGEGMKVVEIAVTPEQLKGAEEIFITGSTLEIMPVVSIDDDPIGPGTPGKTTLQLQTLYAERIGEELA